MKIGLLPLYVKLYDDKLPEMRIRLEKFYNDIVQKFEKQEISVVKSPFCRLKNEFFEAVKLFETERVDTIVTVHMAYSPSLESIDALSETNLPIIVLDTTETLEFTNTQDSEEIMYNHGVHGVMDMCSMLTRRGKEFSIVAGHFETSNCIKETCGLVRAIVSANALKGSKVGLFGGLFDGMGDFQVSDSELNKTFGIEVVHISSEKMKKYVNQVSETEIETECKTNESLYDFDDNLIDVEYAQSIRAGLAIRKCVEEEKLSSFSINFTNIGEKSGIPTMPFIECCKSMEKGIGYAGEGDVMTAAFVGALLQGYKETNFVEIFCPDWKNNMMFLSHMGEINYRIAATKPCVARVGVNYSPGSFPYVGYARMMGGKGVYLNICRGRDNFKLLISLAEMIEYDSDCFDGSIRGWMKTEIDSAEFLKKLSQNGSTHHSIFVYGASIDEMQLFGKLLNIETIII